MYSCRVKIGSTMPMKIVPMKPAMKKSISGFGERHRGLQLAIQVAFGDVRRCGPVRIEPPAFLGHRNHFQHRTRETALAVGQACAELPAFLHALDGFRNRVHENLVADGLAGDVQA